MLALGGPPGLQDGGRAVPSTSRRATTRSLVGGAGEGGRRLRRGPPTSARAVGLRHVDGTALSRQGAAMTATVTATRGRRARSRLNEPYGSTALRRSRPGPRYTLKASARLRQATRQQAAEGNFNNRQWRL